MKKVILSVLIIGLIVSMAFGFAGCAQATTQGQLASVWRPYEQYTYSVVDTTSGVDVAGTYTVVIEEVKSGSSVAVGSSNLNNVKNGFLVSAQLDIASTVIDTEVYFEKMNKNSYLLPKASYREVTVGTETKQKVQGSYTGGKFVYTGLLDGKDNNGEIEVGGVYYDNNEFHQVLRGATTLASGFSFTFTVPVVSAESSAYSVSATCSSTAKVVTEFSKNYPVGSDNKNIYADGIDCFVVGIERSTKVDGAEQSLFYSKDPVSVNGFKLAKVLTKIVEPNNSGDNKNGSVTYTLDSISLIK